jgi:hypothetical protein
MRAFTILYIAIAVLMDCKPTFSQCSLWMGNKWPSNSVGFWIDSNVPISFTTEIVNSAEAWYVPSCWSFEGNGSYQIYMEDFGEPLYVGFGQTKTMAQGGYLFDVHTRLNSNSLVNWVTTGMPDGTQVDVQTVMTHEFGHWIDLKHSSDPNSTMYDGGYTGTAPQGLTSDVSQCATYIYCNPVGVCDNCPPGAPTGFSASATGADVTLNWDSPLGRNLINVSVFDGSNRIQTLAGTSSSYVAIGAMNTLPHSYTVRFVNIYGMGPAPPAIAVSAASSVISGNVIWSGIVRANQSVTVNNGSTLTALPGTTIQFAQYVSFTAYGMVLANGTDRSRITFTSASPSGTWSGIYIGGSGANGSSIQNVTINHVQTYGGSALSINGATGVKIKSCNISNNVNYGTNGVYLTNAGSPEIAYNTVNSNGGYGVVFSNTNGNFYKDTVKYNYSGGVQCISYSSPMFGKNGFPAYNGNNIIKGGRYGLAALTHSYPYVGSYLNSYIGYNSIDSTSTARVYASNDGEVQAEQNWWGSSSPNPSWFQAVNNSWIGWTPYLTYDPSGGSNQSAPKSSALAGSLQDAGALALGTSSPTGLSDSTWAIIRSAMDYRLTGNFARAKGMLKSIITKAPASPGVAQAAVGLLQLMRDTLDTDVYDFVRIAWLKYKLSDPVVSLVVAEMLAQLSKVSEAATIFNTVVRNNPNTEHEKEGLVDLFYLYYTRPQFEPLAGSIMEKLQAKYPTDDAVKQAAWVYALGNGSSSQLSKPPISSQQEQGKPEMIVLQQNFPNPFNPSTTINYDLPVAGEVSLVVYDVLGRRVVELTSGQYEAGHYSVTWNASDAASGIYFARFTVSDALGKATYMKVNKLVLMK